MAERVKARHDQMALVRTRQRLIPILAAAREDLTKRLAKFAPGSFSAVQANAARMQIRAVIERLSGDLGTTSIDLMKEAASDSLHLAVDSVNKMGKAIGSPELAQIPLAAVGKLAGLTGTRRASILSEMHAKGNASAVAYGQGLIDTFQSTLAAGMVAGKGVDELTADLVATAGPFGQAAWRAERIARTEVSWAFNRASRDAAEDLRDELGIDDVLMRWVEHVDDESGEPLAERVAEDSIALHGQLRRPGEPYADTVGGTTPTEPPNRPNDRATLVVWRASWGEPPGGLARLDAASKAAFAEALAASQKKDLADVPALEAEAKGHVGATVAEVLKVFKGSPKAVGKKAAEIEFKLVVVQEKAFSEAVAKAGPAGLTAQQGTEALASIQKALKAELTAMLEAEKVAKAEFAAKVKAGQEAAKAKKAAEVATAVKAPVVPIPDFQEVLDKYDSAFDVFQALSGHIGQGAALDTVGKVAKSFSKPASFPFNQWTLAMKQKLVGEAIAKVSSVPTVVKVTVPIVPTVVPVIAGPVVPGSKAFAGKVPIGDAVTKFTPPPVDTSNLSVRTIGTLPEHSFDFDLPYVGKPVSTPGNLTDADYVRKAKTVVAKLTRDQKTAVQSFTGSNYGAIRRTQRMTRDEWIAAGDSGSSYDVYKAESAHLETAIRTHSGSSPGVVFRGVKGSTVELQEKLLASDEFDLGGTASSSRSPEVAENFAAGGTHKVLYVLHQKSGLPVETISSVGNGEREIMVSKGTRFRVLRRFRHTKNPSTLIVEAEEI